MSKSFVVGYNAWLILPLFPPVQGEIIDVPTEEPTIQAGIDAANHGDTVLVDKGNPAREYNDSDDSRNGLGAFGGPNDKW